MECGRALTKIALSIDVEAYLHIYLPGVILDIGDHSMVLPLGAPCVAISAVWHVKCSGRLVTKITLSINKMYTPGPGVP